METFLLISAIIVTLQTLIKVHRFNHNLARYMATDTKVYPGGQPLYLMNTVGKWLTFAGGIATAPLVMALTFSPNGTEDWVVASGAWGLFTLLMAAFLISFVFIKHCLKRKFNIRLVLSNMARPLLDKAKQLNGIKVALWIVSVTVLMVFLPFFIELFNALVFVVGFVMAARLGLLDDLNNEEMENDSLSFGGVYNYATGEVDCGIELGGLYDD